MFQSDRQVCFLLTEPAAAASLQQQPRLVDAHAEALAELLAIFACGEESAAISFARLGESPIDHVARRELVQIAGEELVHEGLLRRLRGALPKPPRDKGLRRALAHFFHGVARTDIGLHLAAIASLDSAVCLILSDLLRPGGVIAQDFAVATIFRRIRQDEAKHVRVSRHIAVGFARRDLRGEVAESTRVGLVAVLARRGAAFERLGVDAERLLARLGRVPDGLFE
jgi:hypothetical protein